MGRCTGRRCPAQVGYDVANCNQFDCIFRTEINTNYDRIKSMSVEEMAEFNVTHDAENNMYLSLNGFLYGTKEVATEKNIQWLLQEVSENE